MSEIRARLERLAARGTRRGADDVLRAAIHDAPATPADERDADGEDLEILGGDVPLVSIEPDERRRGRFGTLVAAFGAAALVGVGALAVTAMFGSGGAASPEAAVRQLADAVSHKDPLAAVDVLVPTEVRSMRESIKHVTKRAADLKIVDDASQPLAGVDLSLDRLELSSQPLADGYAKVTITSGELSASTHQAAMSKLLQDAMRSSDTSNTSSKVDLARLASDSDLPTFVITVRHDGHWYVSPAYTALEYAREVNGGPAAAFGSAKAADLGADSPEVAVSDALRAWQAGNWDRLMALAPPDELPVYDYRAWIDKQAADTHPDFTIDKLSTSATVDGDTAIVKLEASGTSGGGEDRGKWQVGGTCPTTGWSEYSYASSEGGSFSQVEGKPSTTAGEGSVASYGPSTRLCLAGSLGQVVPFGLFYADSGETSSSGPVSIEVVREDGRWFVSPVTTVLDVLNNFVDNVDERTLYPMIGLGYALPPDASITLDQSFKVASSQRGLVHVYSFDGTKGQSVVGMVETGGQYGYANAELYTADGRDVGYLDFPPKNAAWGVSPVELPATGSYRLVVTGTSAKDASLTLFDTDHAPKSLLNPTGSGNAVGGITECSSAVGGTKCTTTVTPTTAFDPNNRPLTTVPALPEGCHQTAAGIACSSSGSASAGVATTSVP